MSTWSLYYSYQLEWWTVLRHYGRMGWKKDPDGSTSEFLHQELLDNYFVVHNEFTRLFDEGKFDELKSPLFGEGSKEELARMVFGFK